MADTSALCLLIRNHPRFGDFAHGCLRVLEGLAVPMDEVSPSILLTLLVAFRSGSADCESSAD